MLRKTKISRFLSLAVIVALVFMSIPGVEVWAAEDGRESFVITSFGEQENWPLETSTFPAGTSIEDMKFPSEWVVNGYQKADSEKMVTEKKLTQLVWSGVLMKDEVQKSEERTKEENVNYKQGSEAGIYLFSLKLPEGVEADESVKLPEQKIVIGSGDSSADKTSDTKDQVKDNPLAPGNTEIKDTDPADTDPTDNKQEGTNPTDTKTSDIGSTDTKQSDENTASTGPMDRQPTQTHATGTPVTAGQDNQPNGEQLDSTAGITKDTGEVTLDVKELPGRILVGSQYQIEASAQGATPPPAITYSVLAGADVVSVDSGGILKGLQEGDFIVQVKCGEKTQNLSGRTILPDTDSKIHSFAIGEWNGVITEDPQGSRIEVTVPYGTDLNSLAPSISIGTYAKVNPVSAEAQNFNSPVIYTVTGEDGSQTIYTAQVQGVCTAHQWLPATCTEPEICSVCGEKGKDAAGHQWKAATCTEPKICTVCGGKEGEAAGHQWEAADCTHAEICSRCGQTRGTPLGHSWGEWSVKKQPTTKERGLEERKCSRCQLIQTREIPRLNIIGKAENNQIQGIKANGVYGVYEKITITGYGDGMDNQDPIANDVRYVPSGWHVTSYNAWTKAPYQSAFTVKTEGRYQLQVYFQKQTYDGQNWINNKEVDTKTVDFTISANKAVPVQTGDEAPLGALAGAMGLALLVMAADLGWRRRKRKEM